MPARPQKCRRNFGDSGAARPLDQGMRVERLPSVLDGVRQRPNGSAGKGRPRPLPQVGQALSVTAITGRPAS
jgi:hypothetical protein